MKFLLPTLLTICLAAGRLPAQQSAAPDDFAPEKSVTPEPSQTKIKYVLIMPEEKTAEPVKSTERNPFGKSAEDIQAATNGKGTTEENNIRNHMEKLKIVGVAPGPKGLRVMLGNMLLETDGIVPPVIADQTMRLRVSRISEQSIELAWVEKKPTGMPASTLVLPVDLRPYVRYKLPGQSAEKPTNEKAIGNKAVVMGTQFMKKDEGEAVISPKITLTAPETKVGPEAAQSDATPPSPAPLPAPVTVTSNTGSHAAEAHPQEPEEWKRAVGFLNDLVKLEDGKK